MSSLWLKLQVKTSLIKALDKLELEFEGVEHRGDDDAYNTAKIMQIML
jgi:inhibitor of KinA sporulation pathway (predicted exonuclease)